MVARLNRGVMDKQDRQKDRGHHAEGEGLSSFFSSCSKDKNHSMASITKTGIAVNIYGKCLPGMVQIQELRFFSFHSRQYSRINSLVTGKECSVSKRWYSSANMS